MSLTEITIRKAQPKDKPYKLADRDGMFLFVHSNGSKYWRLKYRVNGKEKVLALGVYPEVTLSEARDRLEQARKVLKAGNDPGEVKKEAKRLAVLKGENTFEAVAREWHQTRIDTWTPHHGLQIMRRMEADLFPKLGSRPIADIKAPDLLAAARAIEERGALDIAHRAMQTAGQVFAYAIVTGRADRNPATDLRGALKPVKKKHHAYLKADELPGFLQKLEDYENQQTKLAFKLLLLTFVRTTELRAAEWSEFELDKAEWRVPALRMKMKSEHIVPLSKQAVAILRELQPITGQWKHVFPNQHKPAGCMSQNTIIYALYRMGYHSRATGHGFRATASTILNEHGFSTDHIEIQLAHAERNQVRAAYNHAQYLPERRKMMQWWGDYLDAARDGKVITGKFAKVARG